MEEDPLSTCLCREASIVPNGGGRIGQADNLTHTPFGLHFRIAATAARRQPSWRKSGERLAHPASGGFFGTTGSSLDSRKRPWLNAPG
jgi:hypothetical protein